MAGTYVLPAVAQMCRRHLLEEVEVPAVLCVVPDRAVAGFPPHRAGLALAEVHERPIRELLVLVPVGLSRLSGDQKCEWSPFRGDDSALALTAELLVQVTPAIYLPELEHAASL